MVGRLVLHRALSCWKKILPKSKTSISSQENVPLLRTTLSWCYWVFTATAAIISTGWTFLIRSRFSDKINIPVSRIQHLPAAPKLVQQFVKVSETVHIHFANKIVVFPIFDEANNNLFPILFETDETPEHLPSLKPWCTFGCPDLYQRNCFGWSAVGEPNPEQHQTVQYN